MFSAHNVNVARPLVHTSVSRLLQRTVSSVARPSAAVSVRFTHLLATVGATRRLSVIALQLLSSADSGFR